MFIYPFVADVPEVAVFIGYILLFDRCPTTEGGETTHWSVSHESEATGEENAMKKEGAGV